MIRCGQCNGEFNDDPEFLDHLCPEAGCRPVDPQFMGPDFQAIQEAAISRGEARREETVHPAQAAAQSQGQPVDLPDQSVLS